MTHNILCYARITAFKTYSFATTPGFMDNLERKKHSLHVIKVGWYD